MGTLTFPPDISFADAAFDGMMIASAAIYRQDNVQDLYGATSSSTFVRLPITLLGRIVQPDGTIIPPGTVLQAIPCLPKNMKGEELNTPPAPVSQTSHGIQQFLIFMRLVQVDNPAVDLNIKHWLQILSKMQVDAGEDFLNPNDPNAGAVMYNITNISNPAGLDHHLEVNATVIVP